MDAIDAAAHAPGQAVQLGVSSALRHGDTIAASGLPETDQGDTEATAQYTCEHLTCLVCSRGRRSMLVLMHPPCRCAKLPSHAFWVALCPFQCEANRAHIVSSPGRHSSYVQDVDRELVSAVRVPHPHGA